MVISDITNQLNAPPLVGLVGEVGLVIQEVRLVFTLRLHCSQQVTGGFVSQSVAPCQFLVGEAHESAGAQQTG